MSSYRDTFGAELGAMNSPDRARQFLPFAALTGFEEYIDEEQTRLATCFSDAPSADFDPGFDGAEDPGADPGGRTVGMGFRKMEGETAAAGASRQGQSCGGFVTGEDSASWDQRRMRILNAEHSSKKERDARGKPSSQSQL